MTQDLTAFLATLGPAQATHRPWPRHILDRVGWRALLDRLLEIEAAQGRERPFAGAPRTIDLDLILYGDQVIEEPGLVVPHPRFRERAFVLEPLAAIAADWRDPVTGMTVGELYEKVRPT